VTRISYHHRSGRTEKYTHCMPLHKKGLSTDASAVHSSRLSKLKWRLLMFEPLTPAFTFQLNVRNCIVFNRESLKILHLVSLLPDNIETLFLYGNLHQKKLFTENIEMNIYNSRPHISFMIVFTLLFSLLCLFLSVKNLRYLHITFKIRAHITKPF